MSSAAMLKEAMNAKGFRSKESLPTATTGALLGLIVPNLDASIVRPHLSTDNQRDNSRKAVPIFYLPNFGC